MLDMGKLGDKVKVFQRRATQKVLQQMGIADKTHDDVGDQTYQNFQALGSFTSQLKATIQATDSTIEKMCTAQSHLAGQVQSYLHSELSGDTDLPPGELYEFFNANHIPESQMHAVLLQDVAEKFYSGCSEIGNQLLRTLVNRLDDAVVKPISKDEEFNAITKDLIEDRKKAVLDFDSYRRVAAGSGSPMEQEKNENKVRLARDKLDAASRRVAEHIEQRNLIRCKVLVHGILTAMQQYHIFYSAAAETLKETATAIKPLLDLYQLNEAQLLSTVNLENTNANFKKSGSFSPPQKLSTAESLFNEQEQNNGRPPKPQPPSKPSHANPPPRHSSPQPAHIDDLMQQSIAGMKKPAPPAKSNAPMNQQQAARTPPQNHSPPHSNGAEPRTTSPLAGNNPGVNHNGGQPASPPPKPSLVDDTFDWTSGPGSAPAPVPAPSTTPPPSEDPFGLGAFTATSAPSTSPPPAAATGLDDLLGLGSGLGTSTPLQPGPFTPPLHPNPAFTPLMQDPIKPRSPAPVKNAAGTRPTPPPTYGATSGFPGGFPSQTPPGPAPGFPPQNSTFSQPPPFNAYGGAAKPPPQFQQNFGFDMFNNGQPPQPQGAYYKPNPVQPPPPQSEAFVHHAAADQDTRADLNPAITAKIQNWAERGGRQNNLRSLLSTMHEVVWVDSGWDGLSLSELVTPAQVKKAYRRANMVVHPDKIQNGTVEQKLIAQRIFEALRVSYETFNRDELQK